MPQIEICDRSVSDNELRATFGNYIPYEAAMNVLFEDLSPIELRVRLNCIASMERRKRLTIGIILSACVSLIIVTWAIVGAIGMPAVWVMIGGLLTVFLLSVLVSLWNELS